jgi:general secretion pathway protein H
MPTSDPGNKPADHSPLAGVLVTERARRAPGLMASADSAKPSSELEPRAIRSGARRGQGRVGSMLLSAGFTLLELLIVISIIAMASAITSLAIRDPSATRLQREAERLAALFEVARAQARSLGVAVVWQVPGRRLPGDMREPGDFSFLGLPPGNDIPEHWLEPASAGEINVELPSGQIGVVLGPEPVIGAQRLVLRLANQRLVVASDGMAPFHIDDAPSDTPP